MFKNRIDTAEIITGLLQDKLRLTKLNEQKDVTIQNLTNRINNYERSLLQCQRMK